MNTSPTSQTGSNQEGIRFGALVAQLQTIRSFEHTYGLRAYWRVYAVSLCAGALAWIQGEKFFDFYLIILVVVLVIHDMSVRRIERQIDSVLKTLQESPKDTKI